METKSYDLAVIGAGPGGYVAAIRAAQLGLSVACIEAEAALGGTCLRVGCIPSKALLESSEKYEEARHQLAVHGVIVGEVGLDLAAMMRRKEKVVAMLTRGIASLFKKNGIATIRGRATLLGGGRIAVAGTDGGRELEVTAARIVLAPGSVPSTIPGIALDGDCIGTSTEALAYSEVPAHLVVIGAGVIGLELGSVWRRLGAQVTVLEYLPRILPGTDDQIAEEALRLFQKQGIAFHLGARVTGARADGRGAVVEAEGMAPLQCDRVLVAVGRAPNTAGLGLEAAGVAVDRRGLIAVDAQYATSAPGVYAIGDVIAGPMLAHRAGEEGIACVERFVTGYGHVSYDALPAVVYTHPEIAAVGKTEQQAAAAGIACRVGTFPFRGNGRARTLEQVDGLVKVVADARTDRILGIHILGPRAGDMIAEAAVAVELAASSEDLARAVHAHPTLAEALKEAALAVDGRAIHA
ncbi:MAG: dihydrolipoyl dehydrogenase [Candidatus Schekmanbacteria bacterium]|nr:dihydrolipoyl dehydrogenase [Candidatus Schekmanbacteria bacterium]